MEIEYDGEIYNAHTENDIDDKAINVIPIPDSATNGDVIKAMFPNLKVEDNGGSIYLHYPNGGWIVIDKDWWNAPYKGVEK